MKKLKSHQATMQVASDEFEKIKAVTLNLRKLLKKLTIQLKPKRLHLMKLY